MSPRVLLATLAVLAAPVLGSTDAVAASRHPHAARHHHAARVSIATYRTSQVHKPHRELRAHGAQPGRARLAATQPRHHPLSRGS